MKRAEILGLVHSAISHRPTNTGVYWYLGWIDGKIQCLPMNKHPVPEIIFETFRTHELNWGLDSTEWAELEAKIYTFLKEKGLCEIP